MIRLQSFWRTILVFGFSVMSPALLEAQRVAPGVRLRARIDEQPVIATVLTLTDTTVVMQTAGSTDTLVMALSRFADVQILQGKVPSKKGAQIGFLLGYPLGLAVCHGTSGKKCGVFGFVTGVGLAGLGWLNKTDNWVAATLAPPSASLADLRQHAGARVRFNNAAGVNQYARLLHVNRDTAVLLRDTAGASPERVSLLSLSDLQYSQGWSRNTDNGALLGAIIGGVGMGVWGYSSGSPDDFFGRGGDAVIAGLLGLLVGEAIGGLIGHFDYHERWTADPDKLGKPKRAPGVRIYI